MTRESGATAMRASVRGWRRVLSAVAVAVVALLLAGCGAGSFSGLYDVPLPGGADLGPHPYRVHVRFRDVLDLVPQAGVKVNDVPVGRVERIGLGPDGWTADVTVAVNGDVRLPANAVAMLRQSSLLGEKYVELAPPADATPAGRLADGATIPIDRTNRNPEVEEVLGALSLLLNGGGVGQLQDITRELNAMMGGNETQLRSLLSHVDALVSGLDAHRADITRALDGLNRLSTSLAAQRGQIGGVLTDLGPGIQVLTQQRTQLVTMLQSLDTLSGVAVDTVNASRDDMLADLRALTPTLQKLAQAGQSLPQSFQLLLTYPFPDAAADDIRGDYTNMYVNLDLDLSSVLRALPGAPPALGLPAPGAPGSGPPLPLPTSAPTLPGVPPLPAAPVQPGSGAPSGGFDALLGNLLGGGR